MVNVVTCRRCRAGTKSRSPVHSRRQTSASGAAPWTCCLPWPRPQTRQVIQGAHATGTTVRQRALHQQPVPGRAVQSVQHQLNRSMRPDAAVGRTQASLCPLTGISVCPGTGITEELLTYLTIADLSMREELVLKTAVLAEKCAQTHIFRQHTYLCTYREQQCVPAHLACMPCLAQHTLLASSSTCRMGSAQVSPEHGVVHRHHDHADRAGRRVCDARRVALHRAAGERLCLPAIGELPLAPAEPLLHGAASGSQHAAAAVPASMLSMLSCAGWLPLPLLMPLPLPLPIPAQPSSLRPGSCPG